MVVIVFVEKIRAVFVKQTPVENQNQKDQILGRVVFVFVFVELVVDNREVYRRIGKK